MGIAIVLKRAGGTGPLVTPLHSAGVSGANHRWVAGRIDAPVDSTVNTWKDLIGTHHIGLTYGAATVRDSGGLRMVRIQPQGNMQTPGVYTRPRTVAIVARTDSPGRVLARIAGIELARHSSGDSRLTGNGSGSTTGYVATPGTNGFAVYVGNYHDTAPVLRTNSAESAAVVPTFTPGPETALTLLASSLAGGPNDYVEVISWPTALNADGRLAVYTALKAHYSTVIP